MSQYSLPSKKKFKLKTQLMTLGREPALHGGFVNMPAYRGSTILHPSVDSLVEAGIGPTSYATRGTPIRTALEDAWSTLSGAAGTIVVPTGLTAVSVAILACVKAGDHILVVDSVYGPSRVFCDHFLKKMGVETTYYDPLLGAQIAQLLRPNTAAILTESPGSQTFEVQDIPAIVKVAHAHHIAIILDNTWATPLFFDSHAHGVDIAVEAGTKYLGGHSDVLLGLVSANEAYWPAIRKTFDLFAMCPGPEDVFLGLRGLRTMELRLKEAERQALALATWLETRPEVSRVLHPALSSHPQHTIWQRDFKGSSGVFSIILNPASIGSVKRMVDELELFGIGYSWGGYESLVTPFDCTSYRTATQWLPEGPALRFQVGFEDISDLKADLEAGFMKLEL